MALPFVAASLVAAACGAPPEADAPEADAPPSAERVERDVDLFTGPFALPAEGEDPHVDAVYGRIDAYPDLYLAAVDRRLVHPSTCEALTDQDSLLAYRGLLSLSRTTSEEAWTEHIRESFDAGLLAYDRCSLEAGAHEPASAEWLAAIQARGAALDIGRSALRSLGGRGDSHAVRAALERWEDPTLREAALEYLTGLGIRPQ